MILSAYVYPKLQTSKDKVKKSIKSLVLENRFTVNTIKDNKNCCKLHDSSFVIFFVTLNEKELENVSLNDIWNLSSAC